MFGTPAAAPSFSFTSAAPAPAANMFGAPAAAAAAPATNIFGAPSAGMFGAPATTPSFGLPASTTPTPAATSSFGFGAPAATPAAASSFGFGAPAATTATTPSFGFGAPATSNMFGAPAATPSFGFGAPAAATAAAPSFGFGAPAAAAAPTSAASMFGAPAAATNNFFGLAPAAAAAVPAGPQISLNTRFTQLPDAYRNAIEQTSTDYKKPMREGLDEIARFQPKLLGELKTELGRTSLAAMKLGNQQDLLLGEIRSFHDKAKDNLRDIRKYGASGLQQVQNRGGLGARTYLMSEELPTDFYLNAADKIEIRLTGLIEEVMNISQQLVATLGLISGGDEVQGPYGQQSRIGPQHIIRLIQRQSEAFARVAAAVADIHKQADNMRASYLRMYCYDDGQRLTGNQSRLDPFAAADRAEAANQRLMSKKFKAEEFNRANATTAATSQTQPVGTATATTTPAATGSFAFPTATTTPTTGFGVSGFGNAFSGFGAPATPAATSAFGGFGTAPSVGFSAQPTGLGGLSSSFGAPAGGLGFGGAGFKALDLATANTGLGFGSTVPPQTTFGSTFGGGTSTSRKSGSKSRK